MVRTYEHKFVDISTLKMYELNNKQHPQSQIDMLADLIEKVGFTMPIAIDENNVIVSGHGRYLASIKLGLLQVPAIVLSGFTDKEIKEYRIFDNRISDMAEYNLDNIKAELEAIGNTELDEVFVDMLGGLPQTDADRKIDAKAQQNKDYNFENNEVKTIAIFIKYADYEKFYEHMQELCNNYGYSDFGDLVYNAFVNEKDFFEKV